MSMDKSNRHQTWQMIALVCFLAGLALIFLSLTGCQPGTKYTPADQEYLKTIRPILTTRADSDTEGRNLITTGHWVCRKISINTDYESIIGSLSNDYPGSNEAESIFNAAVVNYCPK